MGFRTCTKILKYFHKFVLPIWFIAKPWLKFFINDLEEDYIIEKMKKLKYSLMSLLLSPLFFLLNKKIKFIFKYLNINL
jgi:hypothetical protein